MDLENNIITDSTKLCDWCTEIDPLKEGKECQEIIKLLKQTMRELNLVSLTAPQIGYSRRIICVKFGENDYRTFINPMIENVSNFQFAREKCSSIPNKEFIRPRFATVTLFYYTPLGKVESRKIIGKSAMVIQHCIDHLDGLLLSDIGLEIDDLWDAASEEERAEVLQAYAESLDVKYKKLQEEIKEDPELNNIQKASEFMAGVASGQIEIDNSLNENSN